MSASLRGHQTPYPKVKHSVMRWTLVPALGAALACGLSACGDEKSDTNPHTGAGTSGGVAGSSGGVAGSSGGTAGSSGGVAGSSGGTAGSNDGTAGSNDGTAGSNDGTAGSNDGTAGSNDGTAGSNDGTAGSNDGTAGSGGSGPVGGSSGGDFMENCESNPGSPAYGPCSSFISPTDRMVIELGPYGAIMDSNVGANVGGRSFSGGAEAATAGVTCTLFAGSFAEDPEATARLLNVDGLEMERFTIYRPGRWVEGEKYPLITWGNGTCAQPEGYGVLLRYVASHGYIVVAANNRFVGNGNALRAGIDLAFAANEDPQSPLYQKVDTTKVGAMGHSQGSQGTAAAARADNRIQSVILWNLGTTATKPFLAVSGDRDLNAQVSSYRNGVNNAPKAAFIFYHMIPGTGTNTGHLTLMMQPHRVVGPAVAWWDMMLKEKPEAREWFVGSSCTLCNRDAEFQYGQRGL